MTFFTKNLNVPGTCKEYNLVLHFIHELQGKRPCLNQTIAVCLGKKDEDKNKYPLNVFSQSEMPFCFPRKKNQNASQVLQEELGLSGPHHWIP